MKKFYRLILFATVAAFPACTDSGIDENILEPTIDDGQPFEIIAAASRTSNHEMATHWCAGDKLTVFHAESGSSDFSSNDEFTVSQDGAQGEFSGTLHPALDSQKTYDWYVIYPYNSQYTSPENQTCPQMISRSLTQAGYNSMAHLAGECFPLVGHVKELSGELTPNVTMKQQLCVVCLKVTNNSGKPLTIENASLSSQNENLTGKFYINFAEEQTVFEEVEGNVSKSVTLSVTDGGEIASGEKAELYFAIKPFTAQNDTITISVNGYEKHIQIGESPVSFQAGKIKTINCNYDLYGEYLITGKNNGSTYAMGVYSSGNNNIHAISQPLEFVGGKIYETDKIISSKVTIRRITSEGLEGMYSIMDSNGKYLYAASSSNNYLKVKDSIDKDSAWEITETEDNCSIIASKSDYSHNILKFNYNGGSPLFSCYEAGSSFDPVSLLSYSDILPADSPKINIEIPGDVEASGATVSISCTISNPITGKSLTVESNRTWIKEFDTSVNGTLSFKVDENTEVGARSAEVTLRYEGAVDVSFTVHQKGSGADYSEVFSSNVTLSGEGGTHASKANVVIGIEQYNAIKAGTQKNKGACVIQIPENTKVLHFHAAAWNNETVQVTVEGSTSPTISTRSTSSTFSLLSDAGIKATTPFTLESDPTLYYFTLQPNGATKITFTATNGNRFVLFGVNAEEKDKEPSAQVTTYAASGITSEEATLKGSFSNVSGIVVESGFEWGMSQGSLLEKKVSSLTETFSAILEGLTPETTYYYRAYTTVCGTGSLSSQQKTFYGETLSFKTNSTLSPTGWLELPARKNIETFIYNKFVNENIRNYSYCYDTNQYASLWTAYPLTYSHTQGDGHTGSWKYNPQFDVDKQVNIVSGAYEKNYGNGTYARGHMCPNADRKSSDVMNGQTYYSTNQLPQIQNGFNSGIWSNLESAVRGLTSFADTVYVAVGPCYQKVGESKEVNTLSATSTDIHPSTVKIPNYYYKVLLKVRWNEGKISSASAIGFWLEHRVYTKEDNQFSSYAVSVDQVEEWTGIDFFTNLPESIEEVAEKNTSWQTFSDFVTASPSTSSYVWK